MNSIWQLDIDTYFEIIELAKSHGKKEGDSMLDEFIEIMERKNIKPISHTELNKEELIREWASHGKKILDMTKKENKDDKGS
jgi:hypothetical protein